MDYNSNNNRCGCGTPPTTIAPLAPGPCPQLKQPISVSNETWQSMPCGCRQMPARNNCPIAMAYVPVQQWNKTYPLDEGLKRGTFFPELDIPFVMGRCR